MPAMPKKRDDDEELLTVTGVSAYLGVSIKTVRRWWEDGKLPGMRTQNGYRLFRTSDVAKLKPLVDAQREKMRRGPKQARPPVE